MNTLVKVIVAVFILANPLWAGFGSVVASFHMPITLSYYALTWDGSYLWTCGYSSSIFARVTTTGSLVSSFSLIQSPPKFFEGAAFDGQYLWSGMVQTDHGYFDRYTTSGSHVSGFSTNNPHVGMTWNGVHLLLGNRKYTTTGSFVSSFPYPSRGLSDMAWYHGYIWSGSNTAYVYQATENGAVVGSFVGPNNHGISGLTFDGQYLWAMGSPVGWCYKIDIDVVDVEPGSLGRVKSVYR